MHPLFPQKIPTYESILIGRTILSRSRLFCFRDKVSVTSRESFYFAKKHRKHSLSHEFKVFTRVLRLNQIWYMGKSKIYIT